MEGSNRHLSNLFVKQATHSSSIPSGSRYFFSAAPGAGEVEGAGGKSELKMSVPHFQFPSAFLSQTSQYFPTSWCRPSLSFCTFRRGRPDLPISRFQLESSSNSSR